MALLALPRKVVLLDRDLREGVWHRHGGDHLDLERPSSGQDRGARRLRADRPRGRGARPLLGASTVAVTRHARDGARPLAEIADVLRGADFAVVSLPGQAGTVIGEAELEALGRTATSSTSAAGRSSTRTRSTPRCGTGGSPARRSTSGTATRARKARSSRPSRHPFDELDNVIPEPARERPLARSLGAPVGVRRGAARPPRARRAARERARLNCASPRWSSAKRRETREAGSPGLANDRCRRRATTPRRAGS